MDDSLIVKIRNGIYQDNIISTSSFSGTTYHGSGSNLTNINSNQTWTTIKATSDQTVTNTSGLTVSDYLQFTTSPNVNYHIRLRVLGYTSSGTADFKYRVTHSGGTTTRVLRMYTDTIAVGTSGTIPTGTILTSFDSSDRLKNGLSAGNLIIYEDIDLKVGASGGLFNIAFAQIIPTSGQTASIYQASYLEYMII